MFGDEDRPSLWIFSPSGSPLYSATRQIRAAARPGKSGRRECWRRRGCRRGRRTGVQEKQSRATPLWRGGWSRAQPAGTRAKISLSITGRAAYTGQVSVPGLGPPSLAARWAGRHQPVTDRSPKCEMRAASSEAISRQPQAATASKGYRSCAGHRFSPLSSPPLSRCPPWPRPCRPRRRCTSAARSQISTAAP